MKPGFAANGLFEKLSSLSTKPAFCVVKSTINWFIETIKNTGIELIDQFMPAFYDETFVAANTKNNIGIYFKEYGKTFQDNNQID